jgi:hypothetical protein
LFLHGGLLGGAPEDSDAARLRTDVEADSTARAAGTGIFGGVITVVIQTFGEVKHLGWAGLHTEAATLTFFRI